MTSGLLERTDQDTTTITDDGDASEGDRLAHYFRKEDLERVWLEGATVRALCGHEHQPTRAPDNYPTCQKCKQKWEAMSG